MNKLPIDHNLGLQALLLYHMPRKKEFSGARKRHLATEKKKHLSDTLEKMPKLSSYFTSDKSSASNPSTSETSEGDPADRALSETLCSEAGASQALSSMALKSTASTSMVGEPTSSHTAMKPSSPGTSSPTETDQPLPDERPCMSMDPADWLPLRVATVNVWVAQTQDVCENARNMQGDYYRSKRYFQPTDAAPKGYHHHFKQ